MAKSKVQIKKIGVLTSGGDAPGMNAAVRAVVSKAITAGLEVVGIKGGYKGLIDNDIVPLTKGTVSDLTAISGTVLYTERCDEFKTEEGMQKAIETCKANKIDAIVAIGGDGTFRGATDLANRGIYTVGIPATIDNDITATDYTIGFDTAMNTTLDMIDCLRDTCESHARLNVVEVMGRRCGDIAMLCAIACGAVDVVITELPFTDEEVIARIKRAREAGQRGMILIVSEGVMAPDGSKYGEYIAKKIQAETGIETKFARFAHVVRGGKPRLRDRFYASKLAYGAVDVLLAGQTNKVMVVKDGGAVPMDINFALASDRMYKNTLKPGDLDGFTPNEIEEMEAICHSRKTYITKLRDVLYSTGI